MLKTIGAFFTKILWMIGLFFVITAGGLMVAAIGELIAGEVRHGIGTQLGLITFMAGFVFVGIKLIMVQLTERKAVNELKEEQLLLNRSRACGGAITVSAAALDCNLRISDTKKAFERLAMTGVCQVDVSEQGELYYRFPTFEGKKLEPQLGMLPDEIIDEKSETIDISSKKKQV
ncbi:MAG: hypothetical protein KC777_13085 [Cyanobacteria bacterium HKST-UBA02]|nr:hypothetical protein [Cyanobacteria bacterium HKST-UBA02]